MTPHTYEFVTSLQGSGTDALVTAPALPALAVGAPRELGGEGDCWTPEHLLLASLSACFWTTYRALARRRGVPVRELLCRAHATVGKGPEGLELSLVRLAIDVEVAPGDLALARSLVEETERRCLISRSLRAPVRVEAVVTSTASAQADALADL